MKRLKLSKELFFGSLLIGVLSIGLASCGAGGGGTSSGSIGITSPLGGIPPLPSGGGTSQSSGGITPPSSLSFGSYIYPGTDYPNEPIITVYIDGQPVNLLLDTGNPGLVVNQSAVNIPSSDYIPYVFYTTYGDSYSASGSLASATVCLNPSITNSCVVMLIAVNTSGNAFSSFTEAQGDFGLEATITDAIIGSDGITLSSTPAYSYPTYLAQEYGINSFTISFSSLSNPFYANVPPTTPIGEISFGTNAPSTYVPYVSYLGASAMFISYTPSIDSVYRNVFFDTDANFNFLTTGVLYTEIPNFSSSSYENQNSCLLGDVSQFGGFGGYGVLNGNLPIVYQMTYSNSSTYTTSFTTEPSNAFCSSSVLWNVMTGNTIDTGYLSGAEYFGLPAMLGHTLVWVLDNDGSTQGISIDPQ